MECKLPPPKRKFWKLGRHNNDSGAVIVWILLAIALFAALSYAVTQSTRSGGGDASREKTVLNTSSLMQYSTSLENSILRMRISNACLDTQINFANPIVSGYDNPNAPVDKRCDVFSSLGGNLAWQNPPSEWLDTSMSARPGYGVNFFSNQTNMRGVAVNDGSGASVDLTLLVPYISNAMCEEINFRLRGNRSIPSANQAYDNGSHNGCKFRGDYFGCGGAYQPGPILFPGTLTGCVSTTDPAPTHNYFFHVLIPR